MFSDAMEILAILMIYGFAILFFLICLWSVVIWIVKKLGDKYAK
jgi:hypothetical protein